MKKLLWLLKWLRWCWWDTGEGIDACQRGYDYETRKLLRERRRKSEPRYPG